jgi:hypothetical protein
MDKVKDLILLSALAYKNGQYENAARFFTTAMQSDGLDSFVSFLDKVPTSGALTSTVPDSDNTLAPSLSSDIYEIVDDVERVFRATASYLDEGDEIVEAASVEDDEAEDDFVIVASTSTVAIS